MVAGISEVWSALNFFMSSFIHSFHSQVNPYTGQYKPFGYRDSSDEIWWGIGPKGMNFDIFSEDLTASICSDLTQDSSDGT
jgi:hypothetical protein